MGYESKSTCVAISISISLLVIFGLTLATWLYVRSSNYKNIQVMVENWNKGPIIELSTSNGACKMGQKPIINDYWPGTTNGCDCRTALIRIGSSFHRGACSRDRYNYSPCVDIPPIGPVNYTKWGGRTLCGKRIEYSYLDFTVEKLPADCPTGTRSCGIVDTLNNVLCIPNATECPLNKILIRAKTEVPPTDFVYQTLPIDDGDKIIYYTNQDTKGYIVNEFRISEDVPCINNNYYNKKTKAYLLSNEYGYETCPVVVENYRFDDTFKVIDTESLNDLYDQHDINVLLARMPEYQKPPYEATVRLYAGVYDGLSKECKNKIKASNSKEFLDNLSLIEGYGDSAKALTLAAFIVAIISLIVISIFTCVAVFTNSEGEKPIFILILIAIFAVVTLVLCALASSKVNKIPDDYEAISGDNCLDKVDSAIVKDFSDDHNKSSTIGLAGAVFSGILVALSTALFFV